MLGIGAYIKRDRAYFASCKDSTTAQNNRALVDGCGVYACVLAFYTVMSVVMNASTLQKTMYYVFDGVHMLLCGVVFLRPARVKASHRATQTLCVALELSILSFFALEGAFVSTTQHSLYIPIAILLVLLLFNHGAIYYLSLIFAYTGVFALLSWLHKTPEAAINDVYIAVATCISASIGYVLIAKLHRSEHMCLF